MTVIVNLSEDLGQIGLNVETGGSRKTEKSESKRDANVH